MSTHCIIVNCGDGSAMLEFFNSPDEAAEYIEAKDGTDRLFCETEIYEIEAMSKFNPMTKLSCGHWGNPKQSCWEC